MKLHKRTALKAILWELLGLVLIYVLTGSLEISIAYTVIRTIGYYFYLRLWKKLKWGKKT